MMYTSGSECDDAGNTLHAGLLLTSTTTNTISSESDRYKRLWQRTISVGVLVTVKKKSSPSYVPLPPTPTAEQPRRSSSSRSQVAIDIPDQVDEQQLTVDRIVKEKDLGKLRALGDTERIASIFRSDLENGLSDENPGQRAWNTTNQFQAKGFLHFLLKASNSYTIFLLLISAVLSLVTQMFERSPKYGFEEGTIILVFVFLLVTCPAVGNFRQARKLEKKMEMRENRLEVEVRRNGKSQLVAFCDVVVGDIVNLEKGNQIPGDGLFVAGAGLVLDEVLDPTIDCDRNPFLSSGSKVISNLMLNLIFACFALFIIHFLQL